LLLVEADPNAGVGFGGDVLHTVQVDPYAANATLPALQQERMITLKTQLPAAHGRVSVLFKAHDLHGTDAAVVDAFVVAHRHPHELVCSMAARFAEETGGLLDKGPEYAVGYCRHLAHEEAKVRAAAAAARLGALHVDSRALATPAGATAVVHALAAMWGVRGPVDAPRIVAQALRLRSPPPGIFPSHHPASLLHSAHTMSDSTREQGCEELIAAMSSDGECRLWAAKYRELFANGAIVRQSGATETARQVVAKQQSSAIITVI
jgi:hypothetical protein